MIPLTFPGKSWLACLVFTKQLRYLDREIFELVAAIFTFEILMQISLSSSNGEVAVMVQMDMLGILRWNSIIATRIQQEERQ